MQIRHRNTTITLIRNVYAPDKKRCRAVTLGTLSRSAHEIPPELAERLTDAERRQLTAICAHNAAKYKTFAADSAARSLIETLKLVAEWYRQQKATPEVKRLAEGSRAAWTEVLSSMCNSGVGRTRRRKRA